MSSRGTRKKLVTTGTKTGTLPEQDRRGCCCPLPHPSHQQPPFVKSVLRAVAPKTTCLDPSSPAPQCWEMCKIQSKSICICPSFQWNPKPNLGLYLSFKRNSNQGQAFLRCSFPHLLNSSPKSFLPEQYKKAKPVFPEHHSQVLVSSLLPLEITHHPFSDFSPFHFLCTRTFWSVISPKKALWYSEWCLLRGSLCIPTTPSEVSSPLMWCQPLSRNRKVIQVWSNTLKLGDWERGREKHGHF